MSQQANKIGIQQASTAKKSRKGREARVSVGFSREARKQKSRKGREARVSVGFSREAKKAKIKKRKRDKGLRQTLETLTAGRSHCVQTTLLRLEANSLSFAVQISNATL